MLITDEEVKKFDEVAGAYRELHQRSINASGESVDYFVRYKRDCLVRHGVEPNSSILDFGCGVGSLTRLLSDSFREVAGFDPSTESVAVARRSGGAARYFDDPQLVQRAHYDVAVLSGVLHHVEPDRRVGVVRQVLECLRPGGRLFVFEHNPNNPLTRKAVDACPFDDDAILLRGHEVGMLLQAAGARHVRQEYIVFFPRAFAWLRPLEPRLSWCPLGAQTLTIGVCR